MNEAFHVSLFVPEDAPDISRFYREMYGDKFPMRYVYDPEEIARRYDGLNHRTAVVRDDEGRLAGVGSLFRSAPNPRVYEAGQLMVAKRHRQKGVSNLIRRVLIEEYVPQLPIGAVFMEALCSHTFSQHTATSSGLAPMGVELEWMPTGGPGKDGRASANISLLLFFRVFRDAPHAIHPHPAHADFVARRVRALGLQRTVEAGDAPSAPATEAEPAFLRTSGMAMLSASSVGRDWADVLARFEAEAAGCALHVQLNLGDRATPWAVDILRERGFFLSAYSPLWFGTDGILLQKLPAAPDFSLPRYELDESKAVAEAVRADWEAVTARG